MKKITPYLIAFVCICAVSACKRPPKNSSSKATDDGKIAVTFLQLNDVYEIAPLEGGKVAGMARVATLRQQLLQQNKHTYTVLSGDFLNPSAIGTLKYNDQAIKGKQMVETMNAAGVDWVTFGNHEFDIKEKELQACIDLSTFGWVSANVRQKIATGYAPFAKNVQGKAEPILPYHIITAQDADGTSARIGVIGTTLDFAMPDYARYYNADSAAIATYKSLLPQTDFVVLLTHQNMEQDRALAKLLPQVQLIMGGHDHNNMLEKINGVTIAKADANAKTTYIHRLTWNKKNKKLSIDSELKPIDATIADEPATAAVVKKWTQIAEDNCRALGMNPTNRIAQIAATDALEGREYAVRSRRTNLTALVAHAIRNTNTKADAVVYNSGSIRIDDLLSGDITEYDVLRILPFGGKILTVQMKGSLLNKVLQQGAANVGSGGFLQYDEWVTLTDNEFWVGKQRIEPQKVYTVLITDFLMTGKEKGLSYLNRDNPDIVKVSEPDPANKADLQNDIRLAVIEHFKKGGR